MALEPTAGLRAAAGELVALLGGAATAQAAPAREGLVTYVGDADGALEVTIAEEPHRIIARPVEALRLGDAVFVRSLNGAAWSPWLYEQFSHRGDVAEDHPLYFQPRLPYVINLLLGDGEIPLVVGNYGDVEVGAPTQVTGVTLYSDGVASAVVDVLATTYAGFPGAFASICGAAFPTLAAAEKSRDVDLAGWTTTLLADSVLRFQVLSATDAVRLTVAVAVT